MTQMRSSKPGDEERADKIAAELRTSIAKYYDYHGALDDGYKIFLPNVKIPMKHFTNWNYAMEALFPFNPDHPTSLLYEQHGDSYKLIGAMYTAPKRFTEDDLDKRVPSRSLGSIVIFWSLRYTTTASNLTRTVANLPQPNRAA